jgi:GT2 family glycosyltransferase
VRDLMTIDAVVATPTVMARRDLLTSLGGFDDAFRFCEDYELWIRLALISQVRFVPEYLARVRSHADSYSRGRVEVWEGWVQLYDKLAATLQDPGLVALARSRRSESLIHLARRYRLAGRYRDSLGALWRAAPRGMAAGVWWVALVKGVIRPLVPAWILEYRRRRAERAAPT